ncbi:MAG TPA: inositol monophosphatase [Jatrophihabitans sp.]|jgi:fructose-1,6-bisphosphatase/inositol monophosphatase family enzyme|nr:inositol monophosphatase [Jatrophihabitans sp.]
MDDLALAGSLAREAGLLAARMLGEGLTAARKTSISDVVSAADHAAEQLVVERLQAARPEDGIVGEEGASKDGSTGRIWYIDPVDGTYNFLSGLPLWCTAIALDDALGAVYQPAADELWTGGPEHPTTRNGVPLPQLVDRPLADVSVTTYVHPTALPDAARREPLLRVLEHAATIRMLGCGSVEMAAVAAGRLGASVQINSLPWDWLPGAALVRGVGGAAEVVAAHGHRWCVTGAGQTVAEITALIHG